jgi:cell division transport system permease protein
MWAYKLLYHLKTTAQNIREHRATVLMSLAAVGFTLLLLASYLLLLTNLQAIGERLGKELQIMLYLDTGLSGKDRARIEDAVRAREEVEGVEYCSPKEALQSLEEAMGEAAHVLKGLETNPLPPSLEVRLKKDYRTLEAIEEVAGLLAQLKGVADVEYGGAWMKRFFAFIRVLRWLALSLGLLLLFASVIVISSTLTLGFYARKEEIEILRLVGATEWYIRFPFFLESLLQGIGGALLAVGLLWLLFQGFLVNMGSSWSLFAGWVQPHFLSVPMMVTLIFLGAAVGVVSSLLTFSRFSEEP